MYRYFIYTKRIHLMQYIGRKQCNEIVNHFLVERIFLSKMWKWNLIPRSNPCFSLLININCLNSTFVFTSGTMTVSGIFVIFKSQLCIKVLH